MKITELGRRREVDSVKVVIGQEIVDGREPWSG